MAVVAPRNEFISDILETALFGAIQYWATVVKVARNEQDQIIGIALTDHVEEGQQILKVTQVSINQAIKKVIDPEFEVREDIQDAIARASRRNDAGDIDAEAADVLVQAALFNEIVYG